MTHLAIGVNQLRTEAEGMPLTDLGRDTNDCPQLPKVDKW